MNQPAYLLLALTIGLVLGYALGIWADSWKPRIKPKEIRWVVHRNTYTRSSAPEMTLNDIIKNIQERNSVSEYDSDDKASPNQTKEK